jgi:phosphoribosylanthranilate isomerase
VAATRHTEPPVARAASGDAPAEARGAGAAPAPVRVKICGVTNLPDAELAAKAGAWAIGMIVGAESPRSCSLEEARRIGAVLRRRVELAGVYVNAPLERIEHDCEEIGLTLVQLHGDEGPSFAAEVRRRTGARVIKAAQVATVGDVRALDRFHVDFHLLDTRPRGAARRGLRGGTGETFDWSLVASRRSRVPLIVSGGLTPENVAAAIAATHPYAVDSASGTEAAPGHKDPERVHAFIAAATSARDGERADRAAGPSGAGA